MSFLEDIVMEFQHLNYQLDSNLISHYTCKYLKEGKFCEVNEIHPGKCVIGSLVYWKHGGNKKEDCALSMLVNMMSTTNEDWFMIDAGYKAFSPDYNIGAMNVPDYYWDYKGKRLPSFGLVKGSPDLRAAMLSAESSHVFYIAPAKPRLSIGDRL